MAEQKHAIGFGLGLLNAPASTISTTHAVHPSSTTLDLLYAVLTIFFSSQMRLGMPLKLSSLWEISLVVAHLTTVKTSTGISWLLFLSLMPLRLCLYLQLNSLLTSPLRPRPLSLAPTGPMATTRLTGRPFALNPLLSLSSQLATSLTSPLGLSLVLLGNQGSLNHIFKTSQPLN